MFKKLWNRLFGKGPLFISKRTTLMGHEFEIASYNRKNLLKVLEAVQHGAMIFISKRTYVIVGHLPDLDAREPGIPEQQCEGDCENCPEFQGYGKEEYL